MDMKHSYTSIILFALVVAVILVSIFLSYDKYFVRKDFSIKAKISCNPQTESCFKEECDAQDPRCTSDGVLYFKVIIKKAYVNLSLEECQAQGQCQVVYCQDDTIADYSNFETCF